MVGPWGLEPQTSTVFGSGESSTPGGSPRRYAAPQTCAAQNTTPLQCPRLQQRREAVPEMTASLAASRTAGARQMQTGTCIRRPCPTIRLVPGSCVPRVGGERGEQAGQG